MLRIILEATLHEEHDGAGERGSEACRAKSTRARLLSTPHFRQGPVHRCQAQERQTGI